MRSMFSEEHIAGSHDGAGDPVAGGGPLSRPPGRRSQSAVVAAGSLLMALASRALEGVKSLWNRVPHGVSTRVHAALDWTGVPYFLNYLACYEDRHQLSNFAGNLVALHAAHARSSTEQRQQLAQQFEEITESLIMKNGVKKSTHPMRQQRILTQVLADPRCRLDKPAIKVLEIPSSIGMTALDNFATLSQRYGIRAYVMGDLFWQLHYDMNRQCVFDDEFNLLQVKQKNRFFSIYRAGQSGTGDGRLATVWLFPFELVSRYLKRRYVYSESSNNVPIRVLHPDAEAMVRTGDLTVKKMDVFGEIGDRYDLILCFNLLLRSYFPEHLIAKGIENLKNALEERGFLIMGDQVSFSVAQKVDGELVEVETEGRL